jgi:hypothetical protein
MLSPAWRDAVLVLGLAAWAVCLFHCLGAGALELRRRERAKVLGLFLIAAAGLAVAVLFAVQLELIRELGSRPAFIWIHDWRWTLNHAQAISRSGGVEAALDYSGAGLNYHVGPAWLAAAVQRQLGAGLSDALFGVIPLLSVLATVIGGAAALRSRGAPYPLAIAAVGLAMTLPLSDRSVLSLREALPGALLSPLSWPFLTTDLMPNAIFGFAVGVASVALLTEPRSGLGSTALGAMGLASLIQIKPQYYVGFALLLGLTGVVLWIRVRRPGGWPPQTLLAVTASLPITLIQMRILPGDLPYLEGPVWAPATSLGALFEPIRLSSVLAGAAVLAAGVVFLRRHRRMPDTAATLLLPAAAALLGLAVALYALDFPYRQDYVRRLLALGLSANDSAMQADDALSQCLEGPRLLLLAGAISLVGLVVLEGGDRWRRWFLACGALTVAAPVPLLVAGFVDPPSEYAVAEDSGLWAALAQVPREGTLLVASDLADPAQGSKRALRAPLLTAYGGHQFFVSNLRYVHYARADAADRLAELQRFFGTPWSDWHDGWLARTGITHVLTDDRCRAVWEGTEGLPLRLLPRGERWRVYQVAREGRTAVHSAGMASGRFQAAYGKAECLSGATATSHALAGEPADARRGIGP